MTWKNLIGGMVISILGIGINATAQSPTSAPLVQIPMRWVPELIPDMTMVNGFTPHHGFQGTGFRIEPIHRNLSPIDYVAWHDESWTDLTTLFGKAWGWPREMTEAQNADDLENLHYKRFLTQEMMSYEILSPDGARAYGSIYILPGTCGSYHAVAEYWITTPMRAQIEATVYAELKQWLETVWPWQPIYFPGGPNMSDVNRANAYQLINSGICI